MTDSILSSVKKYLGLDVDYTPFDEDIIMNINAAFMVLTQIGVGPKNGFFITDDSAVWTDFVDDDRMQAIRQYVYLKVRNTFDPPVNSFVLDAYNKTISELEWRLNVVAETNSI